MLIMCADVMGGPVQYVGHTWDDSLAVARTAADSMRVCDYVCRKSINTDTVLKYSKILEPLAIRLGDRHRLANAYSTMGWAFYYHSQYDSAIVQFNKEYDLWQDTDNAARKALVLYNLADTYNMLNEVGKSLSNYLKAIIIYKDIEDYASISNIHRNVAERNIGMKQYDVADSNIQLAIQLDRKTKDSISFASDLYVLALMKFNERKYDTSIARVMEVDAICDTINIMLHKPQDTVDRRNVAFKYHHIKALTQSKLYTLDGQKWRIDSAFRHCDIGLEIAKSISDVENMTIIQTTRARICYLIKNSAAGVKLTEWLICNMPSTMGLYTRMELYKTASQCQEGIGDFRTAYVYICEYIKCYMSYVNTLTIKENVEFNTKILLHDKDLAQHYETELHKREVEQRNLAIIIVFLMLVVIFIILVIALVSLRNKKKIVNILNDKNQQLSKQQDEIIAQRNIIEEQRQASERANLIMYQSIRYAHHIQHAALPSEDDIRRVFPDHFVYYEPKDIVSGDFYYVTQNAGRDIFVLADCTGHGVPGGFLSMLGISAIKELLKNPEIDVMPGIILDMMREYVKQALSNDEEVAEAIARGEESFSTADGMDMSIVAYDKYKRELRFAGAYQSLYIARKGEIIRLKGDRMPVGRHINESSSFHTETFMMEVGDMIYMSSDGIVSQIGFSGVKFMSKRLIDFFKSNYMLPCETQQRNITNIMNDWLFGTTQIDDLSLVGIRVVE